MLAGCLAGCSQHHAFINSSKQTKEADRQLLKQVSYEEVATPANERTRMCNSAPFALDTDSAIGPVLGPDARRSDSNSARELDCASRPGRADHPDAAADAHDL